MNLFILQKIHRKYSFLFYFFSGLCKCLAFISIKGKWSILWNNNVDNCSNWSISILSSLELIWLFKSIDDDSCFETANCVWLRILILSNIFVEYWSYWLYSLYNCLSLRISFSNWLFSLICLLTISFNASKLDNGPAIFYKKQNKKIILYQYLLKIYS